MDISKQYNPAHVEQKWYDHWEKQGYFHAQPDDRPPYTIVIPPPNVTGVLHMGHMLNNTIQDVLIRKARLQGYNACWVPGTDHASIATEAKVVAKLKEEGISKHDLSREDFLTHAWDWTDKHGGIILQQLRKLGASCDWERTAFTMDEPRYASVIKVFVDLYQKGKIYRGFRMVNWDPEARTTVSDEEVVYKEVNSKLYYVRYPVEGASDEYVTIATTRPETILGDTAVCINPNDERFTHLKGKRVVVPIANRSIPIIEDDYVDMEFGTGCLKITPAHDANDKEIGERHQLEIIDILHEDGTLNTHGLHYAGQDRFVARKQIAKELEEKGYLIKTEDYLNKVGTSERTGAVIEPRVSVQWFLAMQELSAPALENVLNKNIEFFPAKFINTYRHWMENVRDWCISRQLYWGHRIPAWYYGDGMDDFVVAHHEEEALQLAREKTGNAALAATDLRQDEDVLDTWFSSWLWPISVFDGINKPGNEDLTYFYPTKVLVTAPEILFFWVARMIIAGYEYEQEKPFEHVYLTGIVRDKQGRKMSKSLGNSPDPIELMDKYSADGVRVGMLLSSPAGNDLLFDEKLCEQGRNFANKVWNAMRLVKGWEVKPGENPDNRPALDWFEAKKQQTLEKLEKGYATYSLSEVLKTTYTFIWDDFCSWLLEMVKPNYGDPIDQATYNRVVASFEDILVILHPFMPFITEEIWHLLRERAAGDDLIIAQWPEQKTYDPTLLQQGEWAKEIISRVRDIRAKQQMSPKETVTVYADVRDESQYAAFLPMLQRVANLDGFHFRTDHPENAFGFVVNKENFFVEAHIEVDVEAERERIEKEMDYMKGFISSIQKKLSNERFVNNAPEAVVNKERQKLADGEAKLKSLEDSLARLG